MMKIHTSKLDSNFEKIVSDAIKAHQPVADTGVSVAVIQNGQLVFAGGFGFRDRATSTPVDAETCFGIGSATKAFTTMAVSMQVAQGKFTLDQPVKQLLPDFQLKEQQATDETTLRDILCHRVCLAPHNSLWYLGPFTRSGLYYRLRYLEFAAPFRSTYSYNNLLYMVAGYLLETTLGVSYEDIITTNILSPLGMTSTSLLFADLVSRPNHAKGYENADSLDLKDFNNIGPAGEINSTVLDMAKWVQLFLKKGVAPNGSTLISETALEDMYAPITNPGDGTMYGLGWNVSSVQNKRLIFHTGDPVGQSAYVSFMPDDGLGLVLLTNQHCTIPLVGTWPDKVATPIYDYLLNGGITGKLKLPTLSIAHGLGMAAARSVPTSPAAAPAASPPSVPAITPERYLGMYSNAGYGDFTISRSGSNLIISYYGSSWPVTPASDMIMSFDVPAFGMTFTVGIFFAQNGSGEITGFNAGLVILQLPGQPPRMLPIAFAKR
jgi:CubicO group peptidase (beta-lactamase class C family)